MYIFIDESGIQNQIGNSTVAIVYIEVKNLSKFDKDFKKILQDLKISNFHWTEERWLVREKFINRIIDLDFKVKIGIFKNPVHPDLMIESVFGQLVNESNIRKVIIDAKKPKWYENKLKKILRLKGVSAKKLITVRKDENNNGIQLADCLAGLYRYHHDNLDNKDVNNWIRKINRHEKLFGEFFLEAKKSLE